MIYIFVPLVILIFCMRRCNQLLKQNNELLEEGNVLLGSINAASGGSFNENNETNENTEENLPEVEILDKVYSTES